MIDSFNTLRQSVAAKMIAFTVIAGLALGGLGSVAGATGTDPVADAFASGQTSMTTYIGLGIGVIVALLLLGLGVVILVKYLKKAGRFA